MLQLFWPMSMYTPTLINVKAAFFFFNLTRFSFISDLFSFLHWSLKIQLVLPFLPPQFWLRNQEKVCGKPILVVNPNSYGSNIHVGDGGWQRHNLYHFFLLPLIAFLRKILWFWLSELLWPILNSYLYPFPALNICPQFCEFVLVLIQCYTCFNSIYTKFGTMQCCPQR